MKEYTDHSKLLEKLKKNPNYFLIIIGKNGSGKTHLINQIAKLYDKKDIGKYTINENRQLSETNPYSESKEYNKSIISKVFQSTGESLFDELNDKMKKNIIILDEPTATLDIKNTSFIIEAFIRHLGKIKIISSNDYITLKLLSNYVDLAYNVETGKMESIKKFINDKLNETIKELKNNSPFQEINFEIYKDLKL